MIRKIILLIFVAVFLLLQLTGCAALHKLKWHEFRNEEIGICLEIPGEARHFKMSSSSSLAKEEYDQWTIIDDRNNRQFFIITAKYDQSKYAGWQADELLDSIERPAIGFLRTAKEISKQRILDKGFLMEEQMWQLEKRTNQARSRLYIYEGKIVELIYMYSITDSKLEAGAYFFDSFCIE